MLIDQYHQITKIISNINEVLNLNDFERLYLGLSSLTKKVEVSDFAFHANNYFIRACGVKRMPNSDEYFSWLNGVNRNAQLNHLLMAELNTLKSAHNKTDEQLNKIIHDYKKNGWARFPKALDLEMCSIALKSILNIAKREKQLGIDYNYADGGKLQRIFYLLKKDPKLSTFLENQFLVAILDALFERKTLHQRFHMTGFHANIISPGGPSYKLHIDDNIPPQFTLPDWGIRTSFHFVLEDVMKSNGATLYCPGSHALNRNVTKEDIDNIDDSSLLPMEAEAGDILMWSGRLWHKSGSNKTDKDRVALLTTFVPSFLLDLTLEENHFKCCSESEVNLLGEITKRFLSWEQGDKY